MNIPAVPAQDPLGRSVVRPVTHCNRQAITRLTSLAATPPHPATLPHYQRCSHSTVTRYLEVDVTLGRPRRWRIGAWNDPWSLLRDVVCVVVYTLHSIHLGLNKKREGRHGSVTVIIIHISAVKQQYGSPTTNLQLSKQRDGKAQNAGRAQCEVHCRGGDAGVDGATLQGDDQCRQERGDGVEQRHIHSRPAEGHAQQVVWSKATVNADAVLLLESFLRSERTDGHQTGDRLREMGQQWRSRRRRQAL